MVFSFSSRRIRVYRRKLKQLNPYVRPKRGAILKTVTFNAYICGISENNFSNRIMIYSPISTYKKSFCYEALKDKTVSEFINFAKTDSFEFLGAYGVEELNINRLYIHIEDTLFGLQEDKLLKDIFNHFSVDNIQFAYFLVGGASIHCSGYRFVIHPDEGIHRNTPHVHVCKDNYSVRYSLITLERFKQDSFPRTYARDEKKIIAKIAIPAPSARSFSTTLPEF